MTGTLNLDRAQAVDANFIKHVQNNNFPAAVGHLTLKEINLSTENYLDLFDSQLKSRILDLTARQLKERGLAFYTIASSGHEVNAVLGMVFKYTDLAFLHYRSGAFFIQRAKQLPHINYLDDLLLSLMAAKADPISCGRHKVFGSKELFIPPQTSTIASHLPKSLGTAIAITRAKELGLDAPLKENSIVLCSFGDASFNHASAQTTFNAAKWIASSGYQLPLVFVCEDNGIGISVPTPDNWIENHFNESFNMHYIQCSGLDLLDCYRATLQAKQYVLEHQKPVFLHIKCIRILGHAGSDIESQYLTTQQISNNEFNDPLLHSARFLVENNLLSSTQIIKMYQNIKQDIESRVTNLSSSLQLSSSDEVMSSIIPKTSQHNFDYSVTNDMRAKVFGEEYNKLDTLKNLSQCINLALTDLMLQYENIIVFGEDVGKKGGVYRVTNTLQERFGKLRVFDTLLDETIILGSAIGFAHNGFLPIPEIQFLAYLHNAEDQLRGEAATLSFFSNGQYTNPMVIRIASFAYQKGFGGHFHNDNSIAVLRDIPGIIIVTPSNGTDAAKLLREAVRLAMSEKRIVVFLEPIALYMQKDLYEKNDKLYLSVYPNPNETIKFGEIGVEFQGDIVILSYANGYYLTKKAAFILQKEHNITVKIIDIRWLKPLPKALILQELSQARGVLIVDECRATGSLSEELVTMLVENIKHDLKIERITADDSFIPLGNAWQFILPSCDDIVDKIREMH